MKPTHALTRKEFLRTTATAVAATLAAGPLSSRFGYAAGSDRLRVGLVGCGGRGTGAAMQCVQAAPGVELVALGDLFADRLATCRRQLAALRDSNKVTDDRCFTGFDAYQKVIDSGVDLVLFATPPGFRPAHLRAAVEAGKHAFVEKPIAVDPAGVRSVIQSADLAAKKGLAIVAGTQYRHHAAYIENIKRIHDGAIGDLVAGQCWYNTRGLWMYPRRSEWSDVEWQIRNWLYFTWLSGDHIVEQHVHNLDVMTWVFRGHPVRATGVGGRQARTDPAYGHIYDHFAIDYEFPNGVHVTSMCRQMDGTATKVADFIVGSRGTSDVRASISGANPWRFQGRAPNPYVQEHADLIASIRSGTPLNEGRQVAESTLTAVMGRMAAYTGQEVTWEQVLNSKLDLTPEKLEFGPMPVAPVARPGQTPLI